MLIIVAYAFLTLSKCIWWLIGPENGPALIFEKNQKSLKTFCKNPSLLKMILILLGA
jgi:hypothetical protein